MPILPMNMTNTFELETTPCPLCFSEDYHVAYDVFSPFSVVRCIACGFYYLSPRLSETAILRMYQNDTYFEGEKDGYASYIEQEQALRKTFRRLLLDLGKRKMLGGRLLEVGCGYGYLLNEAKDYFEYRVGTEFSPRSVEIARYQADHVYEGGIEQLPCIETFNCIIATQVIEHVYHPREFLKKLVTHLKHGGTLVIATPDMGSFWRHLMGNRWPSFKIPEHVLYFDKTSLRSLMAESGLVNISLLPYPHAFPLSLVASKLHLLIPSFIGRLNLWLPATTLAMYGVYSGE